MTPLYLLCYIIYHIIISTVFSLTLAFRLLLSRVSAGRFRSCKDPAAGNVVALYEGTVFHGRRHPVHHSFRLTARYALINLDLPPYSPPKYLSADDARRAAKTNGPVFLLRIPPSMGYERSPVNIYYCYDIEGSSSGSSSDSGRTLKKCIVEAYNSPWGESVTFVFNPSSDLVPKAEYISPFMDMDSNWRFKVSEPGDNLYAIFTVVQHPKFGNYFSGSLTAKRVINIKSFMPPEDYEAFFWLMPHKVAIVTYWHALRLWWKNVPFYEHPRKENPAYREETFARDNKIQFCPVFTNKLQPAVPEKGRSNIDRNFIWKDSKWPWSCWCR